jgi:uncharacterized membrane protein YeaQ/YmgE (transglycosylase-associated protein family)
MQSLLLAGGLVLQSQAYRIPHQKGSFNLNSEENAMSFLAWIVLGLIAGYLGSKIVNKTGEGLILDIILGIVGALVGGWLFNRFGAAGVTGLNLYSLLVAVIGAVVVLVVYHMIRRAV